MFLIDSYVRSLKEQFSDSSLITLSLFIRNPHEYFKLKYKKHGNLFPLRFPRLPTIYVCSEPEVVQQLVRGSYDDQERVASLDAELLFLGAESILYQQGDMHRSRRKIINPLFASDHVRTYGAAMKEITDGVLSNLQPGQRLSMQGKMQDITMRVVIRCLFGITDETVAERLKMLTIEYLQMVFGLDVIFLALVVGLQPIQHFMARQVHDARKIPASMPVTISRLPLQRIADRIGRIYAIIESELDRCLVEGPESRQDLLASLLRARSEDGRPISRQELCEQLLTMLVAGYEVTAIATTWVIYCLLRYPHVLSCAVGEIEQVMGGGGVVFKLRS